MKGKDLAPMRARSSARIERRPAEPEVPGSNPGGPATTFNNHSTQKVSAA